MSKLSGRINPLVKKILAIREGAAFGRRLEIAADGEQITIGVSAAGWHLQQDVPAHLVGSLGYGVRAEQRERLYAHRQAERIPVQLWGRVHHASQLDNTALVVVSNPSWAVLWERELVEQGS